jgi:molybdopterin converting factor small subunit
MKLLFFGKLRESIGSERELADVAGETVAGLRLRLAARYPQAADDISSPSVRACVGDTIVDEAFVVAGHDAVEFFPPLSGG